MSRRLIVLLNSMLNSHYVYCYKKICYFFAISRFVFSNYHSLSIILFFLCGGGTGIRTLGRLPFTRFPSVPIRPLSHSTQSIFLQQICNKKSEKRMRLSATRRHILQKAESCFVPDLT